MDLVFFFFNFTSNILKYLSMVMNNSINYDFIVIVIIIIVLIRTENNILIVMLYKVPI